MSSKSSKSLYSDTANSILSIGTIIGIIIGSLAGLFILIGIIVIIIICCKKKRPPVMVMPQQQQQQQQQMFQMGSYGQGSWQTPPFYNQPPSF